MNNHGPDKFILYVGYGLVVFLGFLMLVGIINFFISGMR